MKISYEWLKDYLEGELPSPEKVAELLTFGGLEVEGIERPGEALADLIVGEVRRTERHPDADKLSVCEVFDGAEVRQVVCGAPNVQAGHRYPFAPVGATLPGGLTIRSAKLRGVRSDGMLCSARELELSEEHEGLMDLGTEAKAGTPLTAHLGLEDVVLEVNATPNRPDALSHVGVARDLAALAGLRLRVPEPAFPEGGGDTAEAASVAIEAAERCARYVARVVEGVRIGPSPAWMVARLRAAGVRAINNVVDVTNYVLMELGQPLHAFDLDRVAEHRIVVRPAGEGEKLTTLDDVERTLVADDLVIADGRAPVALAGVMGGGDSEVSGETTRLLIESAWFEPTGVRRTAKRHGLHTESSHRFERGADPGVMALAADRAAQLIAELGGGTVRAGRIDVNPRPARRHEVRLRYARTGQVLGLDVPAATQRDILQRLGFEIVREGEDEAVWAVPTFRTEMAREIDLIEEVARIHGYAEIPATLPAVGVHIPRADPVARQAEVTARLREAAAGQGCLEVLNYSFLSEADVHALFPGEVAGRPEARPVALANPLSAEQAVMRTTLLSSLLGTLRHNRRWQATDLKLYEVGRVYLAEGVAREPMRFGAVLTGRRRPLAWTTGAEAVDYYDAKGLVEAALARAGIVGARYEHTDALPWLHPRSATRVRLGEVDLGWIGEIHPTVRQRFDLPQEVVALELEVDAITQAAQLIPAHQEIPRFPAVLRDLAVVVDADIPSDKVAAALTAPLPEAEKLGVEVTGAVLFDVYTGAPIPEGKKSLAWSVRFQAADRTLTEQEAGTVHEALVARLRRQLGAELRA